VNNLESEILLLPFLLHLFAPYVEECYYFVKVNTFTSTS